MNDRALSLLEKYDIEVLRTKKGRGAFICDTKQGCLTLKEYGGNPEKLMLQQQILQRISEIGLVRTEEILPTKENLLYVQDTDGTKYILKTYFEGCECNIYDLKECVEVMQLLARLHHCMEDTLTEPVLELAPFSLLREYEKHNRELTRVWSYLKKKGQKQTFERRLLSWMEYYVNQSRDVTEQWRILENGDNTSYCHGDFQYHNILFIDNQPFFINFEKCIWDNATRDICYFLRKILEKHDWSIKIGEELLNAYEQVRPLSEAEHKQMYYRFLYPEKFWKIVNFYYNNGKAFIPWKTAEKLENILRQEAQKQDFIKVVLCR